MNLRSPRKRILVVDDDEATRTAIARLFSQDYEVLEAADGLQGLEAAISARPDLVIADVWMPVVDGVTMAHHMKGDPALHATPIIFLTGQTSPASVIAGIGAGARHYLMKPVDPDVLEQRVRRLLETSASRAPSAQDARREPG